MRKYDLYVSVAPSKGLEDVSYAQDFLLEKIETRNLRAFCKENNVPHTDVYRMATGERQPGYYIIRALRFVIPPAWWFTPMTEKKPRGKKMNKEAVRTDFENSKGFGILLKGEIREWVEEGCDFNTVYRLRAGKYDILTFKRILYFAAKIPPEYWFIFES